MNIKDAQEYRNEVLNLLSTSKLSTDDLPITLDNFYVAIEDDIVAGVAGLEVYGNYGLLRSVAVSPFAQNKGIAAHLLNQIETVATGRGLEGIYLLTETAADYFDNHGYEHIARMDVPDVIKESPQFKQVCPESATVMKKSLDTE